ncbi:MAG: 6-phosphogluconolactonase, partial [Sphingomonadaceae bacterium]
LGIAIGPDMTTALMTPRSIVEVRNDHGEPPRMSLTKAALLTGRAIVMTAFGEREKAVLQRAIVDGSGSRVPVGRLLAEAEQAIDIHWCP